MKPCPHCAEPMQDAAVVCPHCGRGYDRNRTIRIFALIGVFLIVLVGSLVIAFVGAVMEVDQARKAAEFRKSLGVLPPATREEAQLIIRQAIFRAALREGVEVAAKRYEKSVDEVRAIIDEGTRAGWPREIR